MIARGDLRNVQALSLPVLHATDLVISWIMPMSEHACDFGGLLPTVRALREQVDWDRVASVADVSPYASTFLVLLERLGIIETPKSSGDGRWP